MSASSLDEPASPKASRSLLGVWTAGVLGVIAVWAFQPFYPGLIGPISNVVPATAAGCAFAAALSCWAKYGRGVKTRFERLWVYLALGTGLWFAAETTWAYYYFFTSFEVPYPSVADVFYIGGYFPVVGGLVSYLTQFWGGMNRRRLAAAVGVIALSAVVILGVALPVETDESTVLLQFLSNYAYPLLDLALLSVTLLALAIFAGGTLSKWWMLFAVGSVLYVIGDEYFIYLDTVGAYYNGSFDDLLFILGYLFFMLAFLIHRREL